eukprot:m.64702 g.64702  ORF g.64702 m.64702 type:complete len:512 (-) comp13611_c0_seq2:177-1712(-)
MPELRSMSSPHQHTRDVPPGIKWFLPEFPDPAKRMARMKFYQGVTLVLTFLVYTSYHLSRKPISVVKSTLNPKVKYDAHGDPINSGWAPFDDGKIVDGTHHQGKEYLGDLDFAFLFAYAFGMFFSGHVGDRSNLRYFLTFGMLGGALMCVLFGLGYSFNIHSLWYYIVVQLVAGLYQSTGWPSVVAVMGKWFPKGRRGLIMGIWNAHTSVGNILGSIIPAAVLIGGVWSWPFVVAGIIIGLVGILVFLFLTVYPEDIGLPAVAELDAENEERQPLTGSLNSKTGSLGVSSKSKDEHEPIGFLHALRIPGVLEFSMCLFFTKLVSYTFLYWLPFYLKHNKIGGKTLTVDNAAYLSTLFDVGGIIGGIIAGAVSDRLNGRALTTTVFLILAIPALFLYRSIGDRSLGLNILFMILSGIFVNGPYALITTAVSADLGTHQVLAGNPKALGTVTAIIDGMGSIGAAIGPFLTGAIPSWNNVFYMLMSSILLAAIMLTRLNVKEWKASRRPGTVRL